MMPSRAMLALTLALVASSCCQAKIELKFMENIKLPSSYRDNKFSATAADLTYEWDKGTAEKAAVLNNFVAVCGEGKYLQIIDISMYKARKSQVTDVYYLDAKGTDVQTCKTESEDLVAASTVGKNSKLDSGRVLVFSLSAEGKLTLIKEISTQGSLPDSIKWTKDCKTIVAAIEGEAGPQGTSFVNPLGGVTFIKFPADKSVADGASNAVVTFKDFSSFESKMTELTQAGVRYILRPERIDQFDTKKDSTVSIPANQATFARDLEPEFVIFNSDESKAWLTLQENCAVAIVDMTTMSIVDIKPIPHKDWSDVSQGFDASNKDDKINLANWNVMGMRMPDSAASYKAGDKEYIVIANEGDDKEYIWDVTNETVWAEMIRGKDVNAIGTTLAGKHPLADVNDQAKLGRLKVGKWDGLNGDGTTHDELYTMGGRSFSIIDTSDWSIAFDSGADFEAKSSSLFGKTFNAELEEGTITTAMKDERSDDKGPEVESLALATQCGKTIAFVGTERTSQIFVYDITDPKKVEFQSAIEYVSHCPSLIGNAGMAPEKAYEAMDPSAACDRSLEHIGAWDPEAISYDPATNLVVVAGSLSGTVAVFEVDGWDCAPATGFKDVVVEPSGCTGAWSASASLRSSSTLLLGALFASALALYKW